MSVVKAASGELHATTIRWQPVPVKAGSAMVSTVYLRAPRLCRPRAPRLHYRLPSSALLTRYPDPRFLRNPFAGRCTHHLDRFVLGKRPPHCSLRPIPSHYHSNNHQRRPLAANNSLRRNRQLSNVVPSPTYESYCYHRGPAQASAGSEAASRCR